MAVYYHAGFKAFHDHVEAGGSSSDSAGNAALEAFLASCAFLQTLHILQGTAQSFSFVVYGVVRARARFRVLFRVAVFIQAIAFSVCLLRSTDTSPACVTLNSRTARYSRVRNG